MSTVTALPPTLPPDTTVLVVDDHQLVATSLVLGLRAEGVAARHEAPRGAAAVLAAAGPGPGLVLLDLDLGRDEQRRPIDGVALVAPLRAAGWRVLVLSGSTDRTRIGGALAEGAVAAVPKAAPFPQLLVAVRAALAGREAMPAARRRELVELHARRREEDARPDRPARPAHPARAGGARAPGRRAAGAGRGRRVRGLAGHGPHPDPVDLREARGLLPDRGGRAVPEGAPGLTVRTGCDRPYTLGRSGGGRMGEPGRVRAGPALGEVVLVAAAAALVVGLARAPLVGGALDPVVAAQVLTPAAAAVAAGAAVLGALVARLDTDPRPRWFAAGLAVYAVVVLPAAALPGAAADLPGRTVRLVAHVVVVVLFALCVRPPARLGSTGTWLVAAGGTALALASGLLPAVAPAAARALVDGPVASVVVSSGWTGIAAAVLATGLHRGSLPLARAGLGLVVLAAAQLHRLLAAAGDPVFGALRLLGLLLVVAGLAQLLARAVAALRDERDVQQEELAAAALHVERAGELAAERDHELRNGLAGLAGITHLLSAPVDGGDHDRLRHAVLAELGRLHTLLDGGEFGGEFGGEPPDGPRDYLVAPVLEGLVALRGERPPALVAEPGLRALGDPAVLAQVVTNLLANCDRHAPGAAVAVTARSDAGRAVVEVRDTGPGLPPGADVLAPGVHDPAGGGTGLGLAISARLVAREGGELAVRTVDDPPGCVAAVRLPAPAPRLVGAEPA